MRKLSLVTASLLAAALGASATNAGVFVIGNSIGYNCYVAARTLNGSRAALQNCTEALDSGQLNARDTVATHVNRGIVRIHADHLAEAMKDFNRAIDLDPKEPESYLNKATVVLRMKGDVDEAIALYNQSLSLETRRPELAYFGRGIANEIGGNLQAAYLDYRRAQELAPRWDVPGRELSRFQVTRASKSRM